MLSKWAINSGGLKRAPQRVAALPRVEGEHPDTTAAVVSGSIFTLARLLAVCAVWEKSGDVSMRVGCTYVGCRCDSPLLAPLIDGNRPLDQPIR